MKTLARYQPLLIAVAALLLLPLLIKALDLSYTTASQIVILGIAAMGLNLCVGYTGLVSFGHAAWFGIGAYAAGLIQLNWFPGQIILPILLSMIFVAAASTVIGVLILRRRGVYFSLLTLALAALCYTIAFRWTDVTGGEDGLGGLKRGWIGPISLDNSFAYYVFVAAIGLGAPIAIGAKDTWTAGGWFDYMDSAVNGGEFHVKLTKGEVPYTDPAVKKTFGYIAEMAKRGYFMPNAASYSWQEAANVLFRGEAGMYLMGQFIKDVAPADVKDKIDFFRFPYFEGRTDYAVDTPTDGFMIPKNAKNKEAAKKFMAYLATAEAQEMFCKPLGRLAANKKVPVPNADAKRGLDMVLGAKTAMQFYDRDAPEEMAAKGMNAIVDIIANPAQLDSILTALDKERVRIYNK
jgi:hypothetical protein